MDRGQLKREKEKNKTDLKQVDRSIIQMNNILFLLLFGVFLGGGGGGYSYAIENQVLDQCTYNVWHCYQQT